MTDKKVKVLFIAGSGRSGSTILSRILGQFTGFFFAGELCKIWRYGLIENRLCGCGLPFKECSFWNDILVNAYGGADKINGQEIYGLRKRTAYMRHIPLMLIPNGMSLLGPRLHRFQDILEKLYHSIQSQTECKVIVDCSKSAAYGYILNSIDSIDMYIVHIVRDPRGVAYSKLEKKLYQPDSGTPVYTGQADVFKSSITWDVQNFAAEAFWKKLDDRYIRIRYEDFCNNPQDCVSRVMKMLREDEVGSPFVGLQRVKLDKNTHTAAGNPVRFDSGEVEIKPDTYWTKELDSKSKTYIKCLTWPQLFKYGYR